MKKKPSQANRQPVKKKHRWFDVLLSLVLVLSLAAGVWWNIEYNKTHYTVEFYQTSSKSLKHDVRVVFLSDLHLREYGKDNRDLTTEITNLAPDLIILGGDFVIDEVAGYDKMVSLCEKLTKIAPVYGVLGNHEDVKIFIQKDEELVNRFEQAGVKLLRNSAEQITLYNSTISIAGVEGKPEDFANYGAKDFVEEFVKTDKSDYRIFVAHVPTYFSNVLTDYKFDLGLAGHVHGGIVRLPKVGGLYSSEEGFLPEYSGGEYTLKNKAKLIVSRGLGDSSDVPRINNIPEISVIDIS